VGDTNPPILPFSGNSKVPPVGHVALVVFENESETKIFDNPNMPFLSSLARQNARTTQYFADVHPSLGNYFMLTTGQVVSNDLDFNGTVDVPNLIREINTAGKTWKAYEEDIPKTGFLGDGPLPYVKTHNPAAYLSDVRDNPAQADNMVSLDQLAVDLAADNLPDFMFIEPNQINSMHDCPDNLPSNCPDDNVRMRDGDAWAEQHLLPVLENHAFQQNGLMIITWDESFGKDSAHGGGNVLTILIGPHVKKGFVSTTFYQHESLLRLMCDALRLPSMAAATNAPTMDEFFTTK
jgi:acid phosphatase